MNVENKYKMYAPLPLILVKTNYNHSPANAYQEVFNTHVEKRECEMDHLHTFHLIISKLYFSGVHPEFFIGGG